MKRLVAGVCAAALLGGASWVWGQEEGGLFEKLDANSDGVVTAEEIEGEEKQAAFDRALRRGDKDGDKKLTKEEFAAATQPRDEDRPREERPRDDRPDRPRDGRPGEDRPRSPAGQRPEGRPDRRAMEEMFDKLDANSDGKLTADEVPEERRARFEEVLKQFDDDGDKAIDKDQAPRAIMMVMMAIRGGPPEGRGPEGRIMEEQFNRFDKNQDGKLTADEIPEERREGFNRLLERFDRDGDKAISKEQFPAFAGMLLGPGGPPPFGGFPGGMPLPPIIRALDGDGDGELSKEEIENSAKALAGLDKNEDGKLSREELMPGFAAGLPGRFPGRPGDRPEGRRPPEEGRPDGDRRPEGRPDAPREGRFDAERLRDRLKEADANSDGKISKEESPDRLKENFDRIDRNGDGSLDDAEIDGLIERLESGRRPDGDRPEGKRRDSDRPDSDRPQREKDEPAKERAKDE